MSAIRLSLFGAPSLVVDGNPAETDTRKAVALFAYLLLTGETHTRDSLAALLWPEAGQSAARAALRRTLSTLKSALGDGHLAISRETIGLATPAEIWCDVLEFRETLRQTGTHGHSPRDVCPACLPLLEQAVALYRGDFMAGFTLRDSPNFDDWQLYHAESLRQEYAGALERLIQLYIQQGQFERAIIPARRWLALDELREEAHRQLMQLYAWSGQRSAALRQYQECERILDQELGVAPVKQTVQLYYAIKDNRLPPPQAVAEPPGKGLTPAPAPGRPPLVGRKEEWQAMQAAYAQAGKGPGQLVVLEGEAGIGKTRLCEDFLAAVRAQGGRPLVARAYEGENFLAYGLFVELLRSALESTASAPGSKPLWSVLQAGLLSEIARLLPEISHRRSDLEPPPPLDSPGAQARFFHSAGEVLRLASTTNPAQVIFFDDLHWADEASVELFSYLVRRLHSWPVLILATWRGEDLPPDHRLRRLLAETQRAGLGAQIRLAPLDPSAILTLVEAVFPQSTFPLQELCQRLLEETEGSPFFLVEYLAALADRPPLSEEDWGIPAGVRDLLRSRLNTLDDTSRQVLQTGAVIGRSFEFDLLRLASGRSEEETISALEGLVERGIVREAFPVEGAGAPDANRRLAFDFHHASMRSFVYEQTSLVRRRLLHRRIGEALLHRVRGSQELSPVYGQVAYHFKLAGQAGEAAHYYRLAGEYARSLFANAEAIAHFQTALTLGHPETGWLNQAIGELYTRMGEYPAALRCFETAAALTPSGSPALAVIERLTGEVYSRLGSWERADCYFQSALDALGDSGDPALRASLYADLSLAAFRQQQHEQAHSLAHQALSLAQSAGDPRSRARSHNILGMLARQRGDLPDAAHHLEQSLRLAEEMGEFEARIAAENNLALVYARQGDLERAIHTVTAALELCQRIGDRHREAALHNNLADLYHAAGQAEAAMAALKQAVVIFAEVEAQSGAASGSIPAGPASSEIWKLTDW